MEVRQETKRQDVIEKLKAVNEMIKKLGVVEAEAFSQDEARLDDTTSLERETSAAGDSQKQFNQVCRGTGPAGLWSHRDFAEINKQYAAD